MKHLIIGDLHVQDSNIQETNTVFDFITSLAMADNSIKSIQFLGDLWHHHNILRQTVCDCATSGMKTVIEAGVPVYYKVGNHDNENPRGGPVNAADIVFKGLDVNVSGFTGYNRVGDSNLYSVGFRTQEAFVETCNEIYQENPDSIILHHQTINGSKYESGMPALGGILPELLPNRLFIGGHVHTKQSFGKFIYVGSPRALTMSDVNLDKGIHIFDDESLTFEFISLGDFTKRFYSVDINEFNNDEFTVNPNWKVTDDIKVNVYGSSDYYKKIVESSKQEIATGKYGRVRFTPHIKKIIDSKVSSKDVETDIYKAFEGYVKNVYNVNEETKGEIWKTIQHLEQQMELASANTAKASS
jgi:DNA repair exonuclease SbcCD nuclease subunit